MPTIRPTRTGLTVHRQADEQDPLVTQIAEADHRPYLHPMRHPLLPLALSQNAPVHHPWQHGCYTGLHLVNHSGFWTEGMLTSRLATDGRIRTTACQILQQESPANEAVSWTVAASWESPTGQPLIDERQLWRFHDLDRAYLLELEWTLWATRDLFVAANSYGGLFMRMPIEDRKPQLLTSTGCRELEQAEQRRARWLAVGIDCGTDAHGTLALCDHPQNGADPAGEIWRIDGTWGFGPSPCSAGDWELASGSSRRFRYQILVYDGRPDSDRINDTFATFIGQELSA